MSSMVWGPFKLLSIEWLNEAIENAPEGADKDEFLRFIGDELMSYNKYYRLNLFFPSGFFLLYPRMDDENEVMDALAVVGSYALRKYGMPFPQKSEEVEEFSIPDYDSDGFIGEIERYLDTRDLEDN